MESRGTARIAATIAGTCIAASLAMAGAAQALPAHFYGMGLRKAPGAADLQNMQAGGVQTVRLVIDWRAVQPTGPGAFDWTSIDAQVRKLDKFGIEVVPQLISTPSWLGTTTHTPPIHSAEQKQAWMAFVSAAVGRYGESGAFWSANPNLAYNPVELWQVWNEMNSPGFWEPTPNPKQYAKLLQISADAIHATNPNGQVVLGGMFETVGRKHSITSYKYLRSLYEDGAKKYFDVVATHPYGENIDAVKNQMNRIHAVIASHNDNAALWVDEIGWGSAKGGSKLNKGLEGQAKILTQAYRYFKRHAKALNLDRVYWYVLRDPKPDPEACGFCTSDGLFTRRGNPKPAWDAFTRFAAP